MAAGKPALVSIGLPVYNAERYLKEALESLLAQDYERIELVISDNASTDATQEICEAYAARDPRIKYHRAEENMGAVWNFNRVFELASGEYFMWAAHDDLRDRSYVSKCAAALGARPEAVLCCTDIRFIDEDGRPLEVPPHVAGIRPVGATAGQRAGQIARACNWYDVYGLIRADALRSTRRAMATWGFDVVLELELCLRGPVAYVPEALFTYRLVGVKTQSEMAGGLSAQGGVGVCWSCLALELERSIWLSPLSAPRRLWLAASFLVTFSLLNWRVAAHLRRDLARTLGEAWRERRWGRVALLLAMAALVYPVYNRLTRAVFNRLRGRGSHG